jgi:PAS domain-containing protein
VEVYLQYVEVPGQVNCLIEIVRDITDRKQVEQERERLLTEANESKDLLRIVLDATPDWIFAKNTVFQKLNEKVWIIFCGNCREIKLNIASQISK